MTFNDQDREYSRVTCHAERSIVILSVAKDLALGNQMLRGVSPERSAWAQHDTTGFGSLKCIIGLGGCSATLMKK
jgi:hypothetical protein